MTTIYSLWQRILLPISLWALLFAAFIHDVSHSGIQNRMSTIVQVEMERSHKVMGLAGAVVVAVVDIVMAVPLAIFPCRTYQGLAMVSEDAIPPNRLVPQSWMSPFIP